MFFHSLFYNFHTQFFSSFFSRYSNRVFCSFTHKLLFRYSSSDFPGGLFVYFFAPVALAPFPWLHSPINLLYRNFQVFFLSLDDFFACELHTKPPITKLSMKNVELLWIVRFHFRSRRILVLLGYFFTFIQFCNL